MTSALVTGAPLPGGAIETRGGWLWSFPSDLATSQGTWPALDGGVSLDLTGLAFLHQQTPGLGALGAGSSRINQAVLFESIARWSASAFPNPGSTAMLLRLIFRETRKTGAATYLELNEAAQRITIRRNGTALELIGELGAYTESVDVEPLIGDYMLLDVLVDFTDGFTAYLNGIDLTRSFAGSALTAFGGDAVLSLLNNTGGSEAAFQTELVFAGLAMSPSLTIEEHRDDANALGVLENGLLFELGDFTWAWSPNRLDDETTTAPSLPGEPDFGAANARLSISDGDDILELTPTNVLRPEGLGKPRIDRALSLLASTVTIRRAAPSGFEAVDGDLHFRAVFKVTSDAVGAQRFCFLEDVTDPTLKFGVTIATNGDLTIDAPSGYSSTAVGAVTLDEWHLLDVSLDRDGGVASVAKLIVLLDGADLGAADHTGAVSDIPADAAITFFDDSALAGSATETAWAFAAFTHDRVLPLARHLLDALALGVVP